MINVFNTRADLPVFPVFIGQSMCSFWSIHEYDARIITVSLSLQYNTLTSKFKFNGDVHSNYVTYIKLQIVPLVLGSVLTQQDFA